MKPGESAISPSQTAVSPGFFETLGIRLVEGRVFDSRDTTDSTRVLVVDERLAQRFWPDTSAVGKRMWLPDSQDDLLAPEESNFINIVGVVKSIRMRALVSEQDQVGAYYFPMSQSGRRSLDYAIKTSVDPSTLIPSVRRVISELDPELPVFDIRSMENRIDESLVGQRTPMLLTAIFALSALGLAAVGIYGMLAYMVQIRTREIGIRVALGSSVGKIFGLVLRDGLIVVALGLVVGLAGSFGLSRVIESQLYGISPLDPFVLAAVAGLVGLVASLACALPALRASRIDAHRALGDG